MKKVSHSKSITVAIVVLSLVTLGVFGIISHSNNALFNIEESDQSLQKYESEILGFSISYPIGWQIKEETPQSGADVLLSNNNSSAFIRIRGIQDQYLHDKTGIDSSIAKYKEILALQDGTFISEFKTDESTENKGGFFSTGEFNINGESYFFEEHGELSSQGRILIIRGFYKPETFEDSIEEMRTIMDSFYLN